MHYDGPYNDCMKLQPWGEIAIYRTTSRYFPKFPDVVEQRDTVRSLTKQARDEGNPQIARQLEAEVRRIQEDFDKTFAEIKNLKIPFVKRLMLLFFGKK